MGEEWAVSVKFFDHGVWSTKSYTYKSSFLPEVGDAVLVPVSPRSGVEGWFNIGKVVRTCPAVQYKFAEGIVYKYLTCIVQLPEA